MKSGAKYLLLLLFCLSGGCRKDQPDPISGDQPSVLGPGKRDFVWSIDSIDFAGRNVTVGIEQMWGSSPTDIWGAAGDAGDVRDCLWHYNGVRWTRATAGTPITQYTGNKIIYAVWGSASNDVWALGRRILQGSLTGYIMHYDGTYWKEASHVPSVHTVIYNVFARSATDIWAGGYEYILHFDGAAWSASKVGDSVTVSSITGNTQTLFCTTGSPWGKDTVQLLQHMNSSWKVIDWTTHHKNKFWGNITLVDSVLYSLAGGVISTHVSPENIVDTSGWTALFGTRTGFSSAYVVNRNDIFLVGQWNLVWHYNGSDWKPISIDVPGHQVGLYSWLQGVWANEEEVFICDTQHGVIYHGR